MRTYDKLMKLFCPADKREVELMINGQCPDCGLLFLVAGGYRGSYVRFFQPGKGMVQWSKYGFERAAAFYMPKGNIRHKGEELPIYELPYDTDPALSEAEIQALVSQPTK